MAALVAALICLAPLFSTNTAQAAGGDVVSVADYGAAADSGYIPPFDLTGVE